MDAKNSYSEFQLIGHRIREIQLRSNLIDYAETEQIEKRLDVRYEINSLEVEDDFITAILSLAINISMVENEQSIFDGDIIFEGCFRAPTSMEQSAFKNMLAIHGCASLYSVARGAISNISSQIFYNGKILLPLVNFVRFNEIKEDVEQKEVPLT